jgi:hypothetical protein
LSFTDIFRLNLIFPATELGQDLLPADPMTTTNAVVHPVDTALAEKDTVIEAHPVVATMMMIVADTVLLHEPVVPLTTIHLHVAAMKTLIAATFPLTHTSMAMADPHMRDLHQGIIHQGSLLMLMSIADATGKPTLLMNTIQ